MTKKHLLFALIVCMSTVWRLLELLEYGEIEVRQVDTYMYFYMLATCFVSFLVGKESATAKKAKEQKSLQGSVSDIRWDTDGDMEALASLPTEVYTPQFLHQEQYDDIEEFLDDVSDWLSDEYGWCHFGFETETDDGGIIKCDTLPE